MVTNVQVDQNYEFPWTELAAMSDNIAWLIQDIDMLDGHRRNTTPPDEPEPTAADQDKDKDGEIRETKKML